MNKIILETDKLIDNTDKNINCTYNVNSIFDVNTLIIDVNANTNLEIYYNFPKLTKTEITINVKKGVKLNIFETINGTEAKIKTIYNLETEATVNTYKFNDIEQIREYVIVYLNGKYAQINYNLKTIAINKEKYDMLIYHNDSDTNSKVVNNGVNIKDGNISINVSSFVKKGNKNCNANQNNRIINLTNNKCTIKPNLYIDEYDVSANHSALIGNFSKEELFYLMSRGINKEESIKLLIKGFLMNNLDIEEEQKQKIENIISKYWR
ncbi:MAG: SufD family Fe-S cluster assembly protein [Bacilli bacterium]|nr:SufD family Fe-S cluster assembly protein [Bacilli bacterium]